MVPRGADSRRSPRRLSNSAAGEGAERGRAQRNTSDTSQNGDQTQQVCKEMQTEQQQDSDSEKAIRSF